LVDSQDSVLEEIEINSLLYAPKELVKSLEFVFYPLCTNYNAEIMSRQQPNRNPCPLPDRDSVRRLLEYLDNFNKLDENADSKSLYQTFSNNLELQQATFRLVQRPDGHLASSSDPAAAGANVEQPPIQVLCQFLLKMYRSTFSSQRLSNKNSFIPTSTANDMIRTRVVVLQYLPHFINLHLCTRFGGDRRSRSKFVDAFLLAIYNTEAAEQQSNRAMSTAIVNMPANPLIRPSLIKVPPLATSSTYHDSARLESEDKLDQRPSGMTFHFESWVFVDNLTASNRTRVLRLLLQTFNLHIVDMSKAGLEQFVKATSRLLERGYTHQAPRIHMDPPLLQELLFGAYVCMYNGFQLDTNRIVEMIHIRASLSGSTDVLLLSNAIKNLASNSSPSQISTSSSQQASTPVMAKNMITNASFRAKKMHTDIPKVQIDTAIEEGNSGSVSASSSSTKQPTLVSMASIVEEEAAASAAATTVSKDEEKATTPMKKEESSGSNKGFNRDKFIAKLQLRKKTQSDDGGHHHRGGGGGGGGSEAHCNNSSSSTGEAGPKMGKSNSSDKKEKKELKLFEKKKHHHQQSQQKDRAERPDKLEMVSEMTPLVVLNVHNGDQQSNSSKEYDTVEKVEELIQMHQLPTETVAIHSPESGTTIF